MNRTDKITDIEFYKDKIGKFSNIDFLNANQQFDTAKGKLVNVSKEGKLFIEGTYKSFVVDILKIINASFIEYNDGGRR